MKTITFLSDVLWTKVVAVPSLRPPWGISQRGFVFALIHFLILNTINESKEYRTNELAAITAA